jgi:hypothetical protein
VLNAGILEHENKLIEIMMGLKADECDSDSEADE